MLVAILVFWPGLVTSFLDHDKAVDINKIQIEVPMEEPALPGTSGAGQPSEQQDTQSAFDRASGKGEPAK
jgi:hypothetical protein